MGLVATTLDSADIGYFHAAESSIGQCCFVSFKWHFNNTVCIATVLIFVFTFTWHHVVLLQLSQPNGKKITECLKNIYACKWRINDWEFYRNVLVKYWGKRILTCGMQKNGPKKS